MFNQPDNFIAGSAMTLNVCNSLLKFMKVETKLNEIINRAHRFEKEFVFQDIEVFEAAKRELSKGAG